MSLNRYAKKRDEVESDIVDALRKAGVSVYLLDQPCDAIAGFRGKDHLLEFKTGKAKLNGNQQKFQDEWRGGPLIILRTIEEALEWRSRLETSKE